MTSGINLFVANLDRRVNNRLLRQEFGRFGNVISADVTRDERGDSKSFGFVHFTLMSDGLRAMREMNGKTILSRAISVAVAKKQKEASCYVGGTKSTYWESEWAVTSPSADRDDLRNIASQISETTSDDSASCYVGGTKSRYWESERAVTSSSTDSDDLSDIASLFSVSTIDDSEIFDVKQRMLKLFEDQLYTDVVFYPKADGEATISAHRAILAVGSSLFAKMLFGEGSENSLGMKMEVQISNLSFDVFSCIVKYLYTDEVFFDSDEHAQAILDGANQFEIDSLVQRCKSYFELQELTEQNVCSKLQTSMTNNIDVLKDICVEYIQNNTFQVINSSDFVKCNPSTIHAICKLPSLNLRAEADLLHAVMRWLNNQNVPSRMQLMEPLVKYFRFLTFTVTEFGDVLKRYPDLLTADDGLKIMLYLNNPPKNPEFKSLPSWLNKNCMKRCTVTKKPYDDVSPWSDVPIGKVIFPLRSTDDSSITQSMTELTSLLQMKCINGYHQIRAIKLSFQGPVSDRSVIKNIVIKVHVSPGRFNIYEHLEMANSLEVRVPFSRVIKARRGDLVDIEVEATNMKFYRFLQFDETCSVPENRHFKCSSSSKPKCGKLYFIKEVEYGPQENPRPSPSLVDNKRRRSRP